MLYKAVRFNCQVIKREITETRLGVHIMLCCFCNDICIRVYLNIYLLIIQTNFHYNIVEINELYGYYFLFLIIIFFFFRYTLYQLYQNIKIFGKSSIIMISTYHNNIPTIIHKKGKQSIKILFS